MRNIDNEIKTWEEVLKREKSFYELVAPATKVSIELCAWNQTVNNMHTAQSNIDKLYKQKRFDELDKKSDEAKKPS